MSIKPIEILIARLRNIKRYTHRVCDDGDGHVDEWDAEDFDGDIVNWADVDAILKEFET